MATLSSTPLADALRAISFVNLDTVTSSHDLRYKPIPSLYLEPEAPTKPRWAWADIDAHDYLFAFNGERNYDIAPGVEIRSTGRYIVLPPSIHPSGTSYEWELSSSPIEEDEDTTQDAELAGGNDTTSASAIFALISRRELAKRCMWPTRAPALRELPAARTAFSDCAAIALARGAVRTNTAERVRRKNQPDQR